MDDYEIQDVIDIEMTPYELNAVFGQFGLNFSDYEDESDMDERIFDDEMIDLESPILDTPVRFSTPSITKLIKRSGVIDDEGIPKGITNNAVEFLSNIAYTRSKEVIEKSLIVLDERGAKILTHHDIITALELLGDNIIYPHIKSL